MAQPPGFKDPQFLNHICRLNKALYGLKQAPRQWFATLTTCLKTLGLSASSANPSLYTYKNQSTTINILIYVDDLLITGNDPLATIRLISQLQHHGQLSQIGPISCFLGIEVTHSTHGIHLNQERYLLYILHKSNMINSKLLSTPITTKQPQTKQSLQDYFDPSQYR